MEKVMEYLPHISTPPPKKNWKLLLSTSLSSFCNISVHTIKTQGCYFFLCDATSSETPVLKLTLGRNARKRLLSGDTTDPSSDKEPAQAVTGKLIPSCAKRRAAWAWLNVGTALEIPWGSALRWARSVVALSRSCWESLRCQGSGGKGKFHTF